MMTISFDKIVSVFVFPLGFAISLGLAVILLDWFGWRRLSRLTLSALFLGLWLASTPLFASFALRTLEQKYPLLAIAETPSADVAIVLGGGVRPPNVDNPYPDLAEAADRILHTIRLWRAGKVKMILVTGGSVALRSNMTSEADAMNQILITLGVKRDVILIESVSRNTHENAVNSKTIWDQQGFTSGLLITSALHMPRALNVFAAQKLTLKPVPIDARAGAFAAISFPLSLLPDVHALDATTGVVKEWIGVVVYQLRGWA